MATWYVRAMRLWESPPDSGVYSDRGQLVSVELEPEPETGDTMFTIVCNTHASTEVKYRLTYQAWDKQVCVSIRSATGGLPSGLLVPVWKTTRSATGMLVCQ